MATVTIVVTVLFALYMAASAAADFARYKQVSLVMAKAGGRRLFRRRHRYPCPRAALRCVDRLPGLRPLAGRGHAGLGTGRSGCLWSQL